MSQPFAPKPKKTQRSIDQHAASLREVSKKCRYRRQMRTLIQLKHWAQEIGDKVEEKLIRGKMLALFCRPE